MFFIKKVDVLNPFHYNYKNDGTDRIEGLKNKLTKY